MGNLMFRREEDTQDTSAILLDFDSACYLSPASDLAHLLLTSTDRQFRKDNWEAVVQDYYDTFNNTLIEFGLILRHLGTSYGHFQQEVGGSWALNDFPA